MNRPGDASRLSEADRAAWAARVKAGFGEQRARGTTPETSPEETLEELSKDVKAGRVVKVDLRLSPEEKIVWYQAANAMGLSTSEWMRDVLNEAAREVLASESLSV